jgi:hypothetical protein
MALEQKRQDMQGRSAREARKSDVYALWGDTDEAARCALRMARYDGVVLALEQITWELAQRLGVAWVDPEILDW